MGEPFGSGRIEHVDVVVIGAGQAGLSAGHHLQRTDLDFVVLDAEDAPGGRGSTGGSRCAWGPSMGSSAFRASPHRLWTMLSPAAVRFLDTSLTLRTTGSCPSGGR
ncbi:FAD-dependent oxidoreductase [Nesterenkonia pannonica]|uniref:FAD-dependent oxidoreductase n=1 Tax=Nesterenkonia pannonica TaxID=1548602 RepID=UPI002164DA68|nr:FAD-dependent oxidoreductase [Nesterenkonia pannonica]